MTLAPGTRIGPYEVTALIGVGGMGEVYRASDANLRRAVAIKVLPASVSGDPDRLARFRREAQVLAALNHPQIAHVYGLETADGLTAIVMELVEGETLEERIARGALALEDALGVARQIAEALEAAHEQGIIHRDLKPANVKLRPDGRVKVLDFGLAKAMDANESAPSDSQSPTATPDVTASGVILGTAPYMSPEQARGRPVDRRSDIWAFGCVLYEMLTRRRAFAGDTLSDAIAAVLEREPDWAALPDAARRLLPVLRRCLEKDPARRLRDIGDVRLWLDEAATQAAAASPAPPAAASSGRYAWLTGAALGLAAGAAAAWLLARTPARPASRAVARFELASTKAGTFAPALFGSSVAISPDGTRVAYSATHQGRPQLLLRRLDQPNAVPVAGTEGAEQPFFSPDGRQLGFINVNAIARVSTDGGPISFVCPVNPGSTRGASWGRDDTIVFAQGAGTGMFRVKAGGGEPERLFPRGSANPDETYAEPSLLPGGRALLYTILLPGGQTRVEARRLDGSGATVVAEGGLGARYLPHGFVLFVEGNRLVAVRFDAASLRVSGEPAPVFEGVFTRAGDGVANLAAADDGTVVYAAGLDADSQRRLVWLDRSGKRLGTAVDEFLEGARNQRLSPDGRRVAITVGNTTRSSIWIYDLTGADRPMKLTHRDHTTFANWSADGRRIYMLYSSGSGPRVRWLPTDGSVLEPERVTAGDLRGVPFACSPDGAFLIFGTGSRNSLLPLSGGAPQPWPGTPFKEAGADFSPDGRFVAYASDPSGRLEIYVRPFPGPGAPVRVSADGGHDPRWSHDGRELFFRNGAGVLAARVLSTAATFRAEPPVVLFEGGFFRDALDTAIRFYDVAPDGRFLMLETAGTSSASVVLVQNWADELARRLGP